MTRRSGADLIAHALMTTEPAESLSPRRRETVEKQLAYHLRRLGLTRADIYGVHDAEMFSFEGGIDGVDTPRGDGRTYLFTFDGDHPIGSWGENYDKITHQWHADFDLCETRYWEKEVT